MLDILQSNKPLIAVHRGKSGANIVENTIASAYCAIKSGADIVEFDVQTTLDGVVVVGHSGTEFARYHNPFVFTGLTPYSVLKRKQFKSAYGQNCGYGINSLSDYLHSLKGKCLFNLDRIWCANPQKVLQQIKQADMFDSVIIKSKMDKQAPKYMDLFSQYENIQYMAICKSHEQFDQAIELSEKKRLKLSGVEVLFWKDDDYFCSEEFFDYTKKNGIFTWVNAISLNGKPDFCAQHGDNVSILNGAETGWRWLIEKGYNIIQTDWPALLSAEINRQK